MKREDTLDEYINASYNHTYIQMIQDCKLWNPNDGVQTIITTPLHTDFSIEPDYLLVCNDDGGAITINSKWFITETVRLMSGQYECHLRRDVFAEAWDELMASACHINRAILTNEDPLIFNPEPIAVNERLWSEEKIFDKTRVPWIVFYGADKPTAISNFSPYKINYDYSTGNKASWEASNEFYYLPGDKASIQINFKWSDVNVMYGNGMFHLLPNCLDSNTDVSGSSSYSIGGYPVMTNPSGIDYSGAVNAFKTQFNVKGQVDADKVLAMDGKVLKDTTENKYYTIRVSTSTPSETAAISVYNSGTYNWAMDCLRSNTNVRVFDDEFGDPHNSIITIYSTSATSITLTELTLPGAVDVKVPDNSVRAADAPYYMWCMPYGKIDMTVGAYSIDSDKDLNIAIANQIASVYNSADKIYDVQILPFCPLPDEYITPSGGIAVNDSSITATDTIVLHTVDPTDPDDGIRGFIFACPKCSFTRQIDRQFYPNFNNYKMENVCVKTRLYSPNYSSSFEFSVAKNGGIDGFNIRCTYMPINPYIRIAPIWGGLYASGGFYGDEVFDKDPRGLILSGDFSIARLNNAWVNYQEQNKNFEAIFNREIKHMDVARKYERYEQLANIGTGAVSGAAAGAFAGGTVGGVPGAIIGGVVGAAGSIGAGIADYTISERMYGENKSYATDLHELNIKNVQAMPQSLAKTTAFNVDNRYFPILAWYMPTDREVELVKEFINNRSMTVDVIGRPIDYIYNRFQQTIYDQPTDRGFISGSIIKIDSIHDTHFIDALNDEFTKGVYLR
jgi:uncharacterized protein YcfJ